MGKESRRSITAIGGAISAIIYAARHMEGGAFVALSALIVFLILAGASMRLSVRMRETRRSGGDGEMGAPAGRPPVKADQIARLRQGCTHEQDISIVEVGGRRQSGSRAQPAVKEQRRTKER